MPSLWHADDTEVVLHRLGADAERGLAPAESTRRLREHGPNAVSAARGAAGRRPLARHLLDPAVLALALAAALCVELGEPVPAAVIAAAAAANVLLAARREQATWGGGAALARLTAPAARVVRGGKSFLIPAAELVPGDLAEVAAGDRVPADLRLCRARQLVVDESALTGGSLPVPKDAGQVLAERAAMADRSNMLFAGTLVTAGEGAGVVTATGMRTQLGRIARLLGEAVAPAPPLRRRLADLAQVQGLALVLCAAAAALRLRGEPGEAALAAVATLAVATVPVALPAAVVSALAAGLRRLGTGGAVARSLEVADALGSVGVVVTDKAGTLTRNEMTVRELLVEDRLLEVTGDGYAPEGRIMRDGELADPAAWEGLGIALRIAALCTSSSLARDEAGAWRADGDPTDGALLALAAKGGAWRDDLAREHPQLAAFPLTVERRRMTTVVAGRGGRPTALTKGDPDAVLALCLHQRTAAGVRPLSPADREQILRRAEQMAERSQRVVGLAYREDVPGLEARTAERSLVWVGLAGVLDPPREGIAAALADGRAAGVVAVIVTGDQREPALALARAIGALAPGDEAICGEELDRLTPEALSACVERYRVVARASATHKVRIVRAWKARGRGVAMIGGEVNDAPALREADVGICLGAGGSEIAAEEAAVRIPDGGLAAVVAALAEGRSVRASLSRAIGFLSAVAVAGTLVALVGALFGVAQALTPLRALWVALAMGAPPALALGAGPACPPSGAAPASPARQPLLGREWSGVALVGGGAAALVALAARLYLGRGAPSAPEAGAITVAASCLAVVALAFGCRAPAVAQAGATLRRDRWLFAAAALSVLLAAAVVQVPPAAGLLGIAPLGRREWLVVALFAPLPLLAVEGARAWLRGRERR